MTVVEVSPTLLVLGPSLIALLGVFIGLVGSNFLEDRRAARDRYDRAIAAVAGLQAAYQASLASRHEPSSPSTGANFASSATPHVVTTERCPQCGRTSTPIYEPEKVATRDHVLEWMRASRESAADFFEAVAVYFGIENEEIEEG